MNPETYGPLSRRDYETALTLGGFRPLPEFFATAGCKCQFAAATIKPLVELTRTEPRRH